jgi:hypothetical protein
MVTHNICFERFVSTLGDDGRQVVVGYYEFFGVFNWKLSLSTTFLLVGVLVKCLVCGCTLLSFEGSWESDFGEVIGDGAFGGFHRLAVGCARRLGIGSDTQSIFVSFPLDLSHHISSSYVQVTCTASSSHTQLSFVTTSPLPASRGYFGVIHGCTSIL